MNKKLASVNDLSVVKQRVTKRRVKHPTRNLVEDIRSYETSHVSILVENTGKKDREGYSLHKYSVIGEYKDGEAFSFPIPAALAMVLRNKIPTQC